MREQTLDDASPKDALGIAIGSGNGKVILLGEHAVVHGHPALAAALGRGVTAIAKPNEEHRIRLVAPAWQIDLVADEPATDDPVATALTAIVEELIDEQAASGGSAPTRSGAVGSTEGYTVEVEPHIPHGAGLGSSAAFAVAVTRALARATVGELALARVEEIANRAERAFHANPSGVDVALAAYGGLGAFRRGEGLTPIASDPIPVVIGLSGEPRSTADLVNRVAQSMAESEKARDAVALLGQAAEEGIAAVRAGDLVALGKQMTEAHVHLASLQLSTSALDEMVQLAHGAHALGAKLTGAGGGGAVVALAPATAQAVVEAWRGAGYTCFTCQIGGEQ